MPFFGGGVIVNFLSLKSSAGKTLKFFGRNISHIFMEKFQKLEVCFHRVVCLDILIYLFDI